VKRLAVLFDNLGPYHIARLAAAAKHFELLAIEVSSTSGEYAWQPTMDVSFKRKTLYTEPLQGKRRDLAGLKRIFNQVLIEHGTEILAIPGWSGFCAVIGLQLALKRNIPVILMSESQGIDAPRFLIKEWVKKRYLSLCQAALVGGTSNRLYLERLRFCTDRIKSGYDVVDNSYFLCRSEEIQKDKENLRTKIGLPDHYFLASARFIAKKNLQRLVCAYADYRRKLQKMERSPKKCWHLVILGDGELRSEIEALIDSLGLNDVVHLPGFKQYQDLPIYYGLADVFIHASTMEQWGLVVNEAMASGLPVLVSKYSGCARDLVEDGRNGFVFDPYDVNALADLMFTISSDNCDRISMGLSSREIISHWTPETFAEGLKQTVDIALASSCPRMGWLDKILLLAMSNL